MYALSRPWTFIAEAWRSEVLQFIADNFPAIILTSAFMERLQSSWSLENLQVCPLASYLHAAIVLVLMQALSTGS